MWGLTASYMRDKVKLQSVGWRIIPHGLLGEPIGHLLAVDSYSPILGSLYCLMWGLTASYMRDKVKLQSVGWRIIPHGLLGEPIGHLLAVDSYSPILGSLYCLMWGLTASYMRDKVKLQSVGWRIIPHGLLGEPIGHLLAVDPYSPILGSLYCLMWGLTASYMRDKVKLQSVGWRIIPHGLLGEPIGHLLAVDPYSPILGSLYCLMWGLTASYMRDK